MSLVGDLLKRSFEATFLDGFGGWFLGYQLPFLLDLFIIPFKPRGFIWPVSFWAPWSIRGQPTPNSKQQKPGGTSWRSSVTCLIACPQKIGRCGPNRAKACEPPNMWVVSSSQPPKKHSRFRRSEACHFLLKENAGQFSLENSCHKVGCGPHLAKIGIRNTSSKSSNELFGSWGQVDNPSPTPKHRLEIPLRGRKHQSPNFQQKKGRRLKNNKELGKTVLPRSQPLTSPKMLGRKKTHPTACTQLPNPKKLPKSLVILFS